MSRLALLIVAIALPASRAWACAACNDADVFKSSVISQVNAQAEAAAAQAAPAAAPQAQAAPQPRERQILGEPSRLPTGSDEAPVRKPSLHIRSFNELK